MDILQNIFGGSRKGAGSGGGLGGLLSSGAFGDIARNVLTNKNGDFSWLKGALVAGMGSMLWKKLTARMGEANAADPQYGRVQANPDERAARIITALVFAAKSDGRIDAQEQAAINAQIRGMNLGRQGEALIQEAMNRPLDPNVIAAGVKDPEEALQLYTLSASVINPNEFMEKAYLDGLAKALGVPDDVRSQVHSQVASHAGAFA